MAVVGVYSVFFVGFLGGLVLEVMHWYNLRRRASFPKYARAVRYWIVTLTMAGTGGLLSVLYFGDRAEGIVALHVGLSAPLILQKLTTTLAVTRGAKSSEEGILDFFRW